MIILGIDPGLTGALALLGHRAEYLQVADIPVMQRMHSPRKGGVRNQVNCHAVKELLRGWLEPYDRNEIHAVIELPIAFPGQQIQTVASSFLTAGHLEGVIQSMGLAHTLVSPAEWKKALNLTKSKEQARAAALRRWPDAASLLKRVMDYNRAEALLIARYGYDRHA